MNDLSRPALDGRFDLTFARLGPRTRIVRQYVSYPFHLTRPFNLDDRIPELTTLYQQSASGGLYRGDILSSRIELLAGATAHLTTQAATIVHDCQARPARLATDVRAGEQSFLALTPDPIVFFPGAAAHSQIDLRIAEDACVFLADAFAWHDPKAEDRPFDHYLSDIRVMSAYGDLLLRDRFVLSGRDLQEPGSPVGRWRLSANYLFVGPLDRLPTRTAIETVGADQAAICGLSALPNRAGWSLRVLARSAVANRNVAEHCFNLAVTAALGAAPARRRK